MIKKQFTLYLENKPGALAKVTARLAKAKVNIEGISVSESTDVGIVQVVSSNGAATRKVLTDAGIPYTVQDISLLRLPNKPGALARITAQLAKDGININYVYATSCTCGPACECSAIISAPNLKRVEAAWKRACK
jgi:hypothetical protein